MTVLGLTQRQKEGLDFIRKYVAANGFTPSYSEISIGLGFKSKSNASRIIDDLVRRGYLIRDPQHARSIALALPSVPVEHDVYALIEQEARKSRVSIETFVNGALLNQIEKTFRCPNCSARVIDETPGQPIGKRE